MADTLASQLIGAVTQQTAGIDEKGLAQSYNQGAQLALEAEKLSQARKQLEHQKAEHTLQKTAKIMDMIKIAHNSKDKAVQEAIFSGAIPNAVRVFGTEDIFSETTLKLMAKSPEMREKALGYQLDVQEKINGGMSPVDAVNEVKATMADDINFIQLDTDKIYKTAEIKFKEDQSNIRTKYIAQETADRAQEARDEAGDVKQNVEANKLFTIYKGTGGQSGTQTRVKQLRGVLKGLRSGEIDTGGVFKNLPFGSDPNVLARLDEKTKGAIDTIRDSINIRLRTGDPNPTEKQINNIFNQAFDARLSPEENIKKLEKLIEVELQTDKNARELFRSNKVKGFVDEEPKRLEFGGMEFDPDKLKSIFANDPKAIDRFAAKHKTTVEKVKSQLGIK